MQIKHLQTRWTHYPCTLSQLSSLYLKLKKRRMRRSLADWGILAIEATNKISMKIV